MNPPSEREFLHEVLRGCDPAVNFCMTLFSISQTLDDLVDRDKPVADLDIFRSFWDAMIELPSNPFYRQNEVVLRPLLAACLQDWWDATTLEKLNRHGRELAFVLRDQLTGVVIQCAGILGGFDWMQEVSVRIRLYFHDELLHDYLQPLEMTP